MILLDTNVLSEAQRARGDAGVKARLAERREDAWLSVVVLGELRYGIGGMEPGPRRDALAAWYDGILVEYSDRILSVDLAVAERWGAVQAAARRAGRTLHVPDGLIAATALVHDLELWTRNVRDFAETGARLFDPWER